MYVKIANACMKRACHTHIFSQFIRSNCHHTFPKFERRFHDNHTIATFLKGILIPNFGSHPGRRRTLIIRGYQLQF